MRERPDELRADFQQFYGLNLDSMGRDYSLLHAATLSAQLPSESRIKRIYEPSYKWSDADYMLRSIEHSLRVLAWQQTKDGQRGRNIPKPIPTPAEESRISSKLNRTDIEHINKKLGIKEV